MTHNITEKKLLIRQQLENVVAEYNKTLKIKEQLFLEKPMVLLYL